MPRLQIDRFRELEVFVKTVELGSFSKVAKHYQMTPSAVSKLIARLEARLGIRLFNRSTRRLQLTPEGRTFYEQGIRVLTDLDEAERSVLTSVPTGHLRVTTNIAIGRRFLIPIIPEFLANNPGVSLDIVLTDRVIDLMEEYIDIAIRTGPLKDSTLIARKLGETRRIIVGAPTYLKRKGIPQTPKDLEQHNRLGFNFIRTEKGWPLLVNGTQKRFPVVGNVQVSDGDALRQLVLEGVGLARLAAFQVREDIEAGRLIPVLEDYNPGDADPLHAIYLGQGGHLPARIRAFLNFLTARFKI